MTKTEGRSAISIGSWLSLGSPFVAELMAKSGFEWLVIDMEHSAANSMHVAQQLIQVIELAGCRPFVRVPKNDPDLIKILLDAGAHGIVVPRVNTAAEAKAAVAAMHYPPKGQRGVGLWRAQGYGKRFKEYMEWFAAEGILMIQIEHKDAVQNLAEILEVDGIDGFLVGPYDLSASMGHPGDFKSAEYLRALDQIKSIAEQTKKWVGIHVVEPDPERLRQRVADGYNFIAFGVDFTYLSASLEKGLEEIRELVGHQKDRTR